MASKYAYYIRGNQIALVEKQDTDENYESPSKAVTNGLRFEYAKRHLITKDAAGANEETGLASEISHVQVDDYLAKAVVYFLKARAFEEMGEFDKKEYYMKEFRAIVGRYFTGRSYGKRQVFPGPAAIK